MGPIANCCFRDDEKQKLDYNSAQKPQQRFVDMRLEDLASYQNVRSPKKSSKSKMFPKSPQKNQGRNEDKSNLFTLSPQSRLNHIKSKSVVQNQHKVQDYEQFPGSDIDNSFDYTQNWTKYELRVS